MKLYYNGPVLLENGVLRLEQVTEGNTSVLPNGILRQVVKTVREEYPSIDLLKKTIAQARENYKNMDLQSNKTVGQLELEKQALEELSQRVNEMNI